MEQTAELTGGGAGGHDVIEQGDMAIVVGADPECPAQIAPPLPGAQGCLLRGRLDALQQSVVAGNAGELAKGLRDLLRLIETTPPLPPPVQGNRDDDFWGLVAFQMIGQQACEQWRQQDLAGIFEPGDQHGVGGLVVADHLQPLPGGRSALAAAADRYAFFYIVSQRCGAEVASRL